MTPNYPKRCRFIRIDVSNAQSGQAQFLDALLDGEVHKEVDLNGTMIDVADLELVDMIPLNMSFVLVIVQITKNAVTKPAPEKEEPVPIHHSRDEDAGKPTKDFGTIQKEVAGKMSKEAEVKISKKNAEIITDRS